ncbi:MAG: hypothetical protein QM696_08895 [Steroidobacteraceae bacterium]
MIRPQRIDPIVGDWYQSHGQLFEVVAIDDAEHVIEIQHADGDLEEIEADDWITRSCAGSLQQAEQPEDAHAAADVEDDVQDYPPSAFDELQGLRASALDDLDLFSSSE